MARRRNSILIIIASVFTFISLAIAVSPFIKFPGGSFIGSSLAGLFSYLSKYVGYFEKGLRNFTLVPFAGILITLLVDAIVVSPLLISCLHTACFATMLIVVRTVQGGFETLPPAVFNMSLIFFVLVVPFIAFDKVRRHFEERTDTEDKESIADRFLARRKASDEDKTETEEERNLRITAMDIQQARFLLTSTEVPEFTAFPMVPIHDDSATLGGSVDTSIFSAVKLEAEIVNSNKAQRQAAEDAVKTFENQPSLMSLDQKIKLEKAQMEVEAMSQLDDEFVMPRQENITPQPAKEPVEQQPEQTSAPIQSPVQPETPSSQAVDYSQKPTIVDEGSSDDDAEYEKILENSYGDGNIDYISGVAGLSSGSEGRKSYLINADKYRYKFPHSSLLKHYPVSVKSYADMEHDPDGITIVETLRQFKIDTTLKAIQHGPTFTLYELQLAPGIRVSSVQNFADNIAMNLAVNGVRILAPIPGKIAIGIEVPNKTRDTIGFDVMYPAISAKPLKIPFVLGKTITGESIVIDLAGTPHLLIAGTTGSGKSVCVNSLICSVLYSKTPQEVRMILVDPKMVELSGYNGIPHLLTPVITQPKRVIKAMQFIIGEMERRMQMFKSCGAKKIEDYNRKIEEKSIMAVKLPYIMVIVDEFADLMMVVGKDLESYIQRITQIARFTGIHLVLATQRPSVDVITGIIKSNIPSRIAFAVSDATNSKIIIDRVGAEKLLGRGDMLYLGSSSPDPVRIQGAYIDPEIESIVEEVKKNGEPDYIDESYFEDEEEEDCEDFSEVSSSGGEDMFTKAWKIVSDRGEASASYLQRKLNIGYNRAATLIEKLEDAGYIGPARGSKPREILRTYIQDYDS